VVDGLGVDSVALCGHSYGAWIALSYALRARPGRVRKLVLIDPTQCFAGFRARYLLRALPRLPRPTPGRVRAFLEWETRGGVPLDPDWLRLAALGAEVPAVRPVTGPRPAPGALRGLRVPVLLLLAERGKAHNIRRVGRRAGELLPDVRAEILPGATHHSLPLGAPPGTGDLIGNFLAGRGGARAPSCHSPNTLWPGMIVSGRG
jgi:pimeloyl-ACP methyl ester carboxylesterase